VLAVFLLRSADTLHSSAFSAGFFSQFGDVKNVRMSRSKKTAQSKGYAFLEFKHPEVLPVFVSIAAQWHHFHPISKCVPQSQASILSEHLPEQTAAGEMSICMSQRVDLSHHLQVAPIAAQAMDGYMMFAQKLKVHVVKRKDVHPELMKGGCCDNLPIHTVGSSHTAQAQWNTGTRLDREVCTCCCCRRQPGV
jgi:RNA recognition motif. (a.k.a. RRM, RBD, or RNP domain)